MRGSRGVHPISPILSADGERSPHARRVGARCSPLTGFAVCCTYPPLPLAPSRFLQRPLGAPCRGNSTVAPRIAPVHAELPSLVDVVQNGSHAPRSTAGPSAPESGIIRRIRLL